LALSGDPDRVFTIGSIDLLIGHQIRTDLGRVLLQLANISGETGWLTESNLRMHERLTQVWQIPTTSFDHPALGGLSERGDQRTNLICRCNCRGVHLHGAGVSSQGVECHYPHELRKIAQHGWTPLLGRGVCPGCADAFLEHQ